MHVDLLNIENATEDEGETVLERVRGDCSSCQNWESGSIRRCNDDITLRIRQVKEGISVVASTVAAGVGAGAALDVR